MLTDRPLRVLLAEDDSAFRELLIQTLTCDGHHVTAVGDGHALQDALRAIDARRLAEPDVILSDVRMPGASGLEVLCGMRHTPLGSRVILMTAFGDADLHDRARAAGAYATFDKPFDLDDLRIAVLHVRQSRRGHEAPLRVPGRRQGQ